MLKPIYHLHLRRSRTVFHAAAAVVLSLGASSLVRADSFPGNGGTGFGGAVGTGSLTITDTAAGPLNVTLNRGAGSLNDDLVVYLDTVPGGFVDNLTFGDNADGGRTAVSGTNNGNSSKSLVSFPFAADYALSIENGFISAFQLNSGGNNSLTFLFGQGQSGNPNDASYSISISAAQMAQIGLTPNSGQTFSFVGSYTSTSAYRSNETIGPSITVPADGAGNAGFANPQTFTGSLSHTLVPEPATAGVLAISGMMLAARRRRTRSAK